MDAHATEVFAFANTLRANKYAPRTRTLYTGALRRFDAWARLRGLSARATTVTDVLDYADALPFTYASQQTFIRTLNAYWRLHLRRGASPSPGDSVRCPKRPEQTYRGLDSAEEARALIAAAASIDLRAETAAALCYFAALRCAETATLPRSADEGSDLNVMGKGAQPRTVPIHDDLRDVLDRCYGLRDSVWMLPGRCISSPVATNTVLTWVRLAGERAGLGRVTPHMLRYTAGGVMLDATDDLHGTAKYLGHSKNSLSITAGYTRRKREKLVTLMNTL